MRRWWLAGTMLATILLGLLASARWAPGVVEAQQGEDAAQVRELAERLLNPPGSGPPGQTFRTTLLPGQLPADLPLDLPLAPDSRLVGSATRRVGDRPVNWEVIVDAPGSTEAVLAFYEAEFAARGFTPGPTGPQRGGFQPTAPVVNRFFCPAQRVPWVALTIAGDAAGPQDVRARVDASNPGPCSSPGGPGGPPPGFDRLPALSVPPGVQIQFSSGGGGGPGGRFSSSATALTEQSPAELELFFARQLEAVGWVYLDGRADGRLAWSVWRVPGEGDFQGFLYVLQASGENRRDLFVQVESATFQSDPRGGPQPVPAPPPAPTVAPAWR